jgi:phage terminase large subunit-like protein
LRGPQFEAAWCDELAKWRYAEASFDMLQFGLRLGSRPRQLITTTPRPLPLIKRLLGDPHTRVTQAPTSANAAHLSPAFLETVVARYAGTRQGRQELDGELIEDRPDALWSRCCDPFDFLRMKLESGPLEGPDDEAIEVYGRADHCGSA